MYPAFGQIGGECAVADVSHDIFRLKFEKLNDYWQQTSDGTIWPWGKTMDTIPYCTKYRDTIRYTVPKRSAVCNGQQSKINAAFSLTLSHAFKRHQRSTAFERCA